MDRLKTPALNMDDIIIPKEIHDQLSYTQINDLRRAARAASFGPVIGDDKYYIYHMDKGEGK
jgi:hypothetical protein